MLPYDQVLSPIEAYSRDGYVLVRDVIDADLLAEMRQHVEWLQKRYGEDAELLQIACNNSDPFWLRIVGDDRLLDLAQDFVGPDIALFASGYFCKAANSGKPVLWHQDGAYWPLEPMQAVTLWLAVDDSTPENGCMRVIGRSHREQVLPHASRLDVPNFLSSGIDAAVNEGQAVDLVLRAGDVSIHHPNIIHGSNANLSARRRCGLAIRYIAATTRIVVESPALAPAVVDGIWPGAFMLRGHDPGVNGYNRLPRYSRAEHMPFRGSERWA